jgi:hypothetical protein
MRCPEVLQFEDDFLEGGFLCHCGFSIYDFGLVVRGLYRYYREINSTKKVWECLKGWAKIGG